MTSRLRWQLRLTEFPECPRGCASTQIKTGCPHGIGTPRSGLAEARSRRLEVDWRRGRTVDRKQRGKNQKGANETSHETPVAAASSAGGGGRQWHIGFDSSTAAEVSEAPAVFRHNNQRPHRGFRAGVPYSRSLCFRWWTFSQSTDSHRRVSPYAYALDDSMQCTNGPFYYLNAADMCL